MGYLQNAFKKVALTGVLATTLVAGTSQSAFAQGGAHAGPPPGPNNQQTTVYQGNGQVYGRQASVPIKAWENDPNYVKLLSAYDHQLAARDKIYKAQANGQQRILHANVRMQEADLEQNRANNMRNPGAWAQYGAQQIQIQGNAQAQSIRINATLQDQEAHEDINRSQYIFDLDNRFRNSPQYASGGVAQPNQGPPPWSTDPEYLRRVQQLDREQDAQYRVDQANTTAQLRMIDANHQSQELQLRSQGIQYSRQGLPGIARLNAQDEIMTANYNMERISVEANFEQREGQREAQRADFVFNLDQQFANQPQYKNAMTAPQQRAPARRGPGS